MVNQADGRVFALRICPVVIRFASSGRVIVRKDRMPKRDAIEVEGTVVEALPDAKFRVALDGGDRVVLAYLSGKVKLNFVRIVPGDRVRLELSPYDLSQGRITWRNRS